MEDHENALSSLNSMLFKLAEIEYIRLDSGWKMKRDFTASHVLLLIAGERGRISTNGKEYRLSRGQCFLTVCLSTAIVYADPDTGNSTPYYFKYICPNTELYPD